MVEGEYSGQRGERFVQQLADGASISMAGCRQQRKSSSMHSASAAPGQALRRHGQHVDELVQCAAQVFGAGAELPRGGWGRR